MPQPFRRVRLFNSSGQPVTTAQVTGFSDLAGQTASFPMTSLVPAGNLANGGFSMAFPPASGIETRLLVVNQLTVGVGTGARTLANWALFLDDVDPEIYDLEIHVQVLAGGGPFLADARVLFWDGSYLDVPTYF